MKMKILLLSIFTSTLFFSTTYSQNVFGFKGGMQLAKITGVGDVPKSLLTTIQLKGVAIFPLTDEVTITPSLGYSGKGYRWNNLTFTDQVGNSLGEGDAIGLFNYIQLTVPLSYKIAPNANQEYYFGAGPYFSYAVSGKGRVKHVSLSGDDGTGDLFQNDNYKRTDAGIAIEMTGRLKKRYLISFNTDIGLANINNLGRTKIKQLAAGLSIGYLFVRK